MNNTTPMIEYDIRAELADGGFLSFTIMAPDDKSAKKFAVQTAMGQLKDKNRKTVIKTVNVSQADCLWDA